MDNENKNKKQLWREYLEKAQFPQELKNRAMEIGLSLMDDVEFLYAVRKCVQRGGGAFEDEKTHIAYETEGEYHILRKNTIELALRQEEMNTLLVDMIDMFEDILPLGSVVDLRKDFLGQKLDLSRVEKVRVVITKRFLGLDKGCYYPYAAVIYPIGMGGQRKNLCFSSSVIEKVVHMGYSDPLEETYVHQMKRQLIIDERRKSMGFASEEERKELERLLLQDGE